MGSASKRSEVSPEPLLLRRARAHRDVAVERHDVPGAEIVAVVSLGGIARRGPEVGEVVRGGRARVVLVVAERGARARVVPPPARVVTALVVRERPTRVDVVTEGEHGAGDRVKDGCGGFVASGAARGHGSGPDEGDRGRQRCARTERRSGTGGLLGCLGFAALGEHAAGEQDRCRGAGERVAPGHSGCLSDRSKSLVDRSRPHEQWPEPQKAEPARWESHSAGFAIRSPRGMGEPHDIAPRGSQHLSCIPICVQDGYPQGPEGKAHRPSQ